MWRLDGWFCKRRDFVDLHLSASMNNLYRSGTLVEKLQQRLDILLSSHQFMFCNQYWCDWSWSCVIILRLITLPSGESNYFHVLTKLICLFWLFGLVLQGMIVVVSRFYSHYLFFIITLSIQIAHCALWRWSWSGSQNR